MAIPFYHASAEKKIPFIPYNDDKFDICDVTHALHRYIFGRHIRRRLKLRTSS